MEIWKEHLNYCLSFVIDCLILFMENKTNEIVYII